MKLGILGGGQLGRMLASAGLPIGVTCRIFDPGEDPCGTAVAEHVRGSFDDAEALLAFARGLDVVTYEFENVPTEAVQILTDGGVRVHPAEAALHVAQDRWNEKRFFVEQGVDTVPFAKVDDPASLRLAIESLGLPAILKTRRFGYDGKGQQYLAHPDQADAAWKALGEVPCILERVVSFDREVSQISVRAENGAIAHYPLVQNRHAGGVLRWSLAPAPDIDPALASRAQQASERVLEALGYVGVLAVEWFQVGDRLLANEMAPRVHNSGHWSIEGADTSQFENHVRAVMGLPLGSTDVRPCSMVNLLGVIPDVSALLAIPGARLHDYGKTPRQGRKLGHVTVLGPSAEAVDERTQAVRTLVEG